ncbi:MAG: cytochrome c biogenesis protein CcsA [Bacteroidota bacterium]
MIKWWKIAGFILVLYSIIQGLYGSVPNLPILENSIRNLYFHVPMWFTMISLLLFSFIYSIQTLNNKTTIDLKKDAMAEVYATTGMLFGIAGLCTGMIWAKNTWGAYWTNDPKLNAAAVATLLYAAYFVLRSSIDDEEKRARIAAVFNVFCFPIYVVLVFVLPRLTDSLHPGNGGNPGFNAYDLDSRLRMVFYPAVLGWILMGFWIADIGVRINKLNKI